jgi:DNA-binding MarR family transcriptional regulator
MDQRKMESPQSAFLLAQIGAHAAAQFAQRLSALQLAPSDAGILRIVRLSAGISQQDLSARLQVHPSRLVSLLDKLESGGFLERKQNAEDRRLYSLHLTEAGVKLLEKVGEIARQHQQAMSAGLSKEENETLIGLLQRVARAQGLTPGVHPGYQRLNQERAGREGAEPVQTRQPKHRQRSASKPNARARPG